MVWREVQPTELEDALNAYAEEGWIVVATATASFTGAFRTGEEMITILMREKE